MTTRKSLCAIAFLCFSAGASSLVSAKDDPDIYRFANACWAIKSAATGQYLVESGAGYALGDKRQAFYLKPTELGSYLLLSGYTGADRIAMGTKKLLGITDPGGEFLDEAGNLVVEGGYVVSGLGDMANFATEPVGRYGRAVRAVGEETGNVGERAADTDIQPALGMVNEANDLAVWTFSDLGNGTHGLTSRDTGLALAGGDGQVGLMPGGSTAPETQFRLEYVGDATYTGNEINPDEACAAYPEADIDAELVADGVKLFRDAAGREVYGFIDGHTHISAYEFIGGRVNYGDPFHKFGVQHAMHDCEKVHGPRGTTGLVEIATSGTTPDQHVTEGWPNFEFWPQYNSLQHHQTYYPFIQRTYMAGLRIMLIHLVHNEILCQLNPHKERDCDGVESITLQAVRMHEMERYIDAQHGGPGKGWFRIVTTPAEARKVIADGKLAVILGIEMSKPLNCGEYLDQAECTGEQMRERLQHFYELGVRNMFPVHKFDNAFGGHKPDFGFGIGTVLTAGNLAETGHPVEVEKCDKEAGDIDTDGPPEERLMNRLLGQMEHTTMVAFPASGQADDPRNEFTGKKLCNVRGLTPLGHELITEMMNRNMIIETDHISARAADAILARAESRGYAGIVSSHNWNDSGRTWKRILGVGGSVGQFASGNWVSRLKGFNDNFLSLGLAEYPAMGFASDVNGMASLPGVSGADRNEKDSMYSGADGTFMSLDGTVRFKRSSLGNRTWDLYEDGGVDHYGLYADLIGYNLVHFGGSEAEARAAFDPLFRSAEQYLRMWEKIGGNNVPVIGGGEVGGGVGQDNPNRGGGNPNRGPGNNSGGGNRNP